MSKEKKKLPFDLYTRNKIISDLINFSRGNGKSLNILDVGGRNGQLNDFIEEDILYLLDIKESVNNELNYFVGDITCAPFKDKVFDVVVSSDLYEHILPENRLNSLTEMLRISKNFVILGAPFYSEEAVEAEIEVNEFYRKIMGNNHPWLFEHIKNGLPSRKELESFLTNTGYRYCNIETNNISNWLLMQLFIFFAYAYHISSEDVDRVYRFYNENFSELGDSAFPTYRTIYFITRDRTLSLPNLGNGNVINVSKLHALNELIFVTISQFTNKQNTHIHNLEVIIQEKDKRIYYLENTLIDIYSSVIWQLLTKYQKLIDIMLPTKTKRRHFYDKVIISIRSIVNKV